MKFLPMLVIFTSCMFHDHHYINDNPIEEIVEAAIDGYLGVDVDLTPGSPEKQRPKVERINK